MDIMEFELDEIEVQRLDELVEEKGSVKKYIFIPTGLGLVIKVKFEKGKAIDITNYDCW